MLRSKLNSLGNPCDQSADFVGDPGARVSDEVCGLFWSRIVSYDFVRSGPVWPVYIVEFSS